MLNTSRLYTFLDQEQGFLIHFLDGQKLIHDLAIDHHPSPNSFAYFRSTVLAFLPMISFLKNGESLGIYLDSEEPYFRFKIETNFAGHTRTLLIPDSFSLFPTNISGQARVSKQFADREPYTSVIEFKNTESSEISNLILSESYQIPSKIIVADDSDQSLLISKLPPSEIGKYNKVETLSLEQYEEKLLPLVKPIFTRAFSDIDLIVSEFEKSKFSYLSSRQVQFFCPCTRENFLLSMQGIYGHDPHGLFGEQTEIEVKCDYCQKKYYFTHNDFLNPLQ